MIYKNIENVHFIKLRDVVNFCLGSYLNGEKIVSDMENASLDDANKIFVYSQKIFKKNFLNLDVIKLDVFTKYRKYLLPLTKTCNQLCAVDAICIDNENEWYFIEFKNSCIDEKETRKSIRDKMVESLWYVFFLYSKAGEDINALFMGDFTKFARKKINYIIVASQSKNKLHAANIQMQESAGKHYTPPGFDQFIGYYYKNVYMLTEIQLRDFIYNFKI